MFTQLHDITSILSDATDKHALVVVADRDFTIQYVNENFEELSQFSRDELVGSSIRTGVRDPELKGKLRQITATVAAEGKWRGEVMNTAKDGTTYFVDITVRPFSDDAGDLAGYVFLATDITSFYEKAEALRSNLDLMNAVFENFPGGISYFTKDLVLASANSMFFSLLDIPEERFPVGCTYEDIIRFNVERGDYGEGDPDPMIRDRVELAKKFEEHTFVRRRPDGTSLEIRGFPLPEGGFVTTYVDVTEQTKAEATNFRLARIIHESINEVFVFDTETLKYLQVNKSACVNLGYSKDELKQMTPLDLKPEYTLEKFEELIAPLRAGEVPSVRFRTVHRRKDDSIYDADITLQQIEADDGQVFAAIVEDITEKRRNENQIAHMALHDALTDLPNRTLLRERMDEAIERAEKGDDFVVLCLDLDRFKTINDTFGHTVGDELLTVIGKRLRGCVRRTDTVARLGGDEFAIVHFPRTSARGAATVARRIGEVIRRPVVIRGHQITVDSSIGIAVAPGDGDDPETLMHRADMAMYRAKADGRGTFHFYESELDARLQERRMLELDIVKGLANEEFELFYQPIVDISRNRITAFEALLRWRHPKRGLVSPGEFIPIAEETGFIRQLGDWVLRRACADAVHWPMDIRVAVNLSPIQFNNQNLALKITKVLADQRFPASRLDLEITESVLMRDTADTLVTLNRLHDLGVRICMDDFGSGYSSLDYLRKFRFDKIKIDRFFIRDVTTHHDAKAIVQAIAGLGTRLGISVVAEGVETTEQLDIVRAEGCTEMQGFLFSKPRSFDETMQVYFPHLVRTATVA